MSRSYSYPDIGLWDASAWEGCDAPIQPKVNAISQYLYESLRPMATLGTCRGREAGRFDPKIKALIFSEVLEEYEKKGLHCHITGMGFMAWIALIPHKHSHDTPVVVRFHSVDMSDPGWAMDTLAFYGEHNRKALENGFALAYLIQDGPGGSGIFTDILMEVSALWRLDLKPIYLDLTGLDEGKFPGGEEKWGLRLENIDDKWQAFVGHQFICAGLNRHNPEFDVERLIHSPLGRRMAEGMRLEHSFRRWDDPALLKLLEQKGVRLEGHELGGERYLTASPVDKRDDLPLLVCMKEVRPCNEFHALTALQFYYDHLDLVGTGECMLLFFAMESPQDNELLCDILDETARLYPVDKSRVYITGQSHNGYLAFDFACRHPERIAAVATLNDRHGLASPRYATESVPVTDEMVERFRQWDLPLINICGQIENVFPHTTPGTQEYRNAVDAYHRRLRALRCPDRTDSEIEAALQSPDLAQRRNGVVADRTETRWMLGHEVYIADVKNEKGRWHLRFVSLENLPHMISPQMAELSWEFLRRFARDGHGVRELY